MKVKRVKSPIHYMSKLRTLFSIVLKVTTLQDRSWLSCIGVGRDDLIKPG